MTARITVLAGTNGAGKSSLAGAALRDAGGEYFNPDEATQSILLANPGMQESVANGLAWQEGMRRLRRAIAVQNHYAFETTLGGRTVTATLLQAAAAGLEVCMWYCGLDSPERHLARVRARVARGGHDIPEMKVRERYDASRQNLIALMPELTTLQVYDNSDERDPDRGQAPSPRLLLEVRDKALRYPLTADELAATPHWARALVVRAHQVFVPIGAGGSPLGSSENQVL